MSNNQISELPIGEFDNLTSLTGVLLGNNQLSYLRAGVFDKLTQLEELELPRNNLLTLPSGVFSKLTALRALDISHNGLFDLSGLGISPTLRGQSEWNAFLQDVTRTLTVSSLPTTPTQLAQVISSNGWSIFKDSNGTELGVASKFVHVGNGVWKESTQPVFQSADRKFDAYSYKLSFSVSGTVTPAPKVITSAAVAATTTWTGSALKPAVSVKAGSTTLKLNTHYTVSYSANTAIGTAKVTVRGKGG
ncbi:MAG: leucine-rich repeat domain-containing protein, partial [Propionibacteriaceae bacterium]|nr:leucine-rich repeat domain-containing protein [Propionibacteriaceae bacterium]